MSNARPEIAAAQRKRVLVYDDDEVFAQECAEALDRCGFVTETRAGQTAFLPLVTRYEPDILVLDLHMPEFDGVEALRALRGYEKKPEVSVVLVSAGEDRLLASAASIAKAYDIRLLGVLNKPLKFADLKSLIVKFDADDKTAQI